MRCECCDRNLNDFESTRKSRTTGEYLNMCNKCVAEIQDSLDVEENMQFSPDEIPDDEIVFDDFEDDLWEES